jgi:hypothetical protein
MLTPQLVSAFPLISTAVVCVCCAVLLARGVKFSFVLFFGVGALLQFMLRLGILVAYPTSPSPVAWSRTATQALAIVGTLSTFLFIAGWISLTNLMLKARRTSRGSGT